MMKKVLAVLLAVCMLATLCGCGAPKPYGSWIAEYPLEADDAKENLELLDFAEEEIAFADLNSFNLVDVLTINENGTYFLGNEETLSQSAIHDDLKAFFTTLYDNRAELVDTYGDLEDVASAEEFMDLYAVLFEMESGEEMLNDMAEYIFSLYEIEEYNESGDCKLESRRIGFRTGTEVEFSYAEFVMKDNSLTVKYADETVTYTALNSAK